MTYLLKHDVFITYFVCINKEIKLEDFIIYNSLLKFLFIHSGTK